MSLSSSFSVMVVDDEETLAALFKQLIEAMGIDAGSVPLQIGQLVKR
jgi:CheY-like chemotaxis protein